MRWAFMHPIWVVSLILAAYSAAHADSRIRTITYAEKEVVDLLGIYGYQITLEFPSNERIENVAVGDSIGWQVTPNKSATALFVKPVEEGEATNMTVVTSLRRYSFALRAARQADVDPGDVIFVLQFEPIPEVKPQSKPSAVSGPAVPKMDNVPAAELNKAYTYSGSAGLIPSRVFDDGRVTYFQWAEGVEAPAIFVILADGKESIVNYAFVDEYIVIDRVASEFSLRRGSEVTRLYNEGFVPVDPGPEAPTPRAATRKARKSVFGIFGRRE